MPWEDNPWIPGFKRRLLVHDDSKGSEIRIDYVPPGCIPDVLELPHRHYHNTVTERAYTLYGDFPHWEFSEAEDLEGDMIVFRRHLFMDRPPKTIHGLMPEPLSETGCVLLYWNTGPGTGVAEPEAPVESVDIPFDDVAESDFPEFGDARLFDTGEVAWQPHSIVPGWKVKPLADAHENSGAVSLVHIPADWTVPSDGLAVADARCCAWATTCGVPADAAVQRRPDLPGVNSAAIFQTPFSRKAGMVSRDDPAPWLFVISGDLGVQVAENGARHNLEVQEGGFAHVANWSFAATAAQARQRGRMHSALRRPRPVGCRLTRKARSIHGISMFISELLDKELFIHYFFSIYSESTAKVTLIHGSEPRQAAFRSARVGSVSAGWPPIESTARVNRLGSTASSHSGPSFPVRRITSSRDGIM